VPQGRDAAASVPPCVFVRRYGAGG